MYGGPLSRVSAARRLLQVVASALLPAVLCIGVTLAGGCSKKVGDSCATNVECSPLGDRFCDLASPDGYCTVEGCDSMSCPDNSTCIRFFSLKINSSATCDSALSPALPVNASDPNSPLDCDNQAACCKAGTPQCCQVGERCLCPQPGCGKAGYCASESTEHRWCMRTCSSDSDCRSGYKCLTTGANGALAVAVPDLGNIVPTVSYCAPPQS
jgi:hypothetical protein